MLLAHYKPVRNVRAERFRFMSRLMKDGESLADFIVELKLLASTCEYGNFLDQALSDKLIWAINDKTIQRQLIEEPLDKKFDDIQVKALSIEMVANSVNDIQSMAGPSNINTNWVSRKSNNNAGHQGESSGQMSKGDLREKLSEARGLRGEREPICYRCQGVGHIARDCVRHRKRRNWYDEGSRRTSRSGEERRRESDGNWKRRESDGNWKRRESHESWRRKRINNVAEEDSQTESEKGNNQSDSYSSDENDGMIKNLSMGHRRKGKSSEPLIISILINKIPITMEIDCGAAYSVMPRSIYLKHFGSVKLNPLLKSLSVITGETIKVVGEINVQISIL